MVRRGPDAGQGGGPVLSQPPVAVAPGDLVARLQPQRVAVVILDDRFVRLVELAGHAVNIPATAGTTVHVEDVLHAHAGVRNPHRPRWRVVVGLLEENGVRQNLEVEVPKATLTLFTTPVMPYSLFAPSVCIWDLRRSAITEFLRTSSARIVSRRMVMRRVRMGVPLLFSSAVSFRKRFLKATSSVPIWRRGWRAFSRFWMVRRRAIRSGPLPESLS